MDAQQRAEAEKARTLVMWSRLGALAGLLTMVGGCGIGVAARVGFIAVAGAVVGFALLVAAAIVGQIGRAMQGRVI